MQSEVLSNESNLRSLHDPNEYFSLSLRMDNVDRIDAIPDRNKLIHSDHSSNFVEENNAVQDENLPMIERNALRRRERLSKTFVF